jgi:hypothetical protein
VEKGDKMRWMALDRWRNGKMRWMAGIAAGIAMLEPELLQIARSVEGQCTT